MSYPGHSLEEYYPSAEMHLVHSTVSADWAVVVVPVRIPVLGQTEIFKYFLYLKPFDCVQTNELWLI